MTSIPKFRNDLKTGTGIQRFMVPKTADVLVAPQNKFLKDTDIPEAVKSHNLNLAFSPQVYVIKMNQEGMPVLTDICGKECDIPHVRAFFRNGEIPEIRLNGFALCLDNDTQKQINREKNVAKQKQMLKNVGQLFQEFTTINQRDPLLSVLHELKHLKNHILVNKRCGGIEQSAMSAEEYAISRFGDEISATTQEFLHCVENYNKNPKTYVFPKEYKTFSDFVQKNPQTKLLHQPQKLAELSVQMWYDNPINASYYGKDGDFVQQTNDYVEKADISRSSSQFEGIMSDYFTFTFEGEKVSCPQVIKKIQVPPHIYEDAQERLNTRKEQNSTLSPSFVKDALYQSQANR